MVESDMVVWCELILVWWWFGVVMEVDDVLCGVG